MERGLAKGEKIVVEGYHKLSHGMKVDAIVARRLRGCICQCQYGLTDSVLQAERRADMRRNFFLDHPVFSIVVSIVIFIIGLIGLVMLPSTNIRRSCLRW